MSLVTHERLSLALGAGSADEMAKGASKRRQASLVIGEDMMGCFVFVVMVGVFLVCSLNLCV